MSWKSQNFYKCMWLTWLVLLIFGLLLHTHTHTYTYFKSVVNMEPPVSSFKLNHNPLLTQFMEEFMSTVLVKHLMSLLLNKHLCFSSTLLGSSLFFAINSLILLSTPWWLSALWFTPTRYRTTCSSWWETEASLLKEVSFYSTL